MFCEHPTCSFEANTICKYHCHLSVCEQHRIEHEKKLLNDFKNELNHLSQPISILLNRTRLNLKDFEQTRQNQFDQINSLYDSHINAMEQRLKFSKSTTTFISSKREQLINYQNGDHQLTHEDYQQIQNLIKQIQQNLQQQYQINNQIRDRNQQMKIYSIDDDNKQENISTEIECIEISDSDNEQSEDSMDVINNVEDISIIERKKMKIDKKRSLDVNLIREYCPLTQIGVFGLKKSHNLPRLCSKTTNRRRYLYFHLTNYHRLKSIFANKITKAVFNGQNPMEIQIFPSDSTEITVANLQCPFNNTIKKFNEKHIIPNTPCTSSVSYHYFKTHLRNIHSINRTNANLIYRAMKTSGTISHIQFEEDLCEIRNDC